MKKAVFLDRDGTLNPDPGYISNPDDFKLFEGVGRALSRLKKAGFFLVLVSNQSGIARGLLTFEQLDLIHKKLQRLLAAENAELDAIYFCPHHPDFASVNGVKSCNCRKPKPGMVLKAVSEHNIDLKQSYVIGDKTADIELGLNTGASSILIAAAPSDKYPTTPTFATLSEAADYILAAKRL